MKTQLVIKYQSLKDNIIDAQKTNIQNDCPFESLEEAIQLALEPYLETPSDYEAENIQQIKDILIQNYPYIQDYFHKN
jgi:hypothetical protein